jgi:membrane-associated protein
MPFIGTVIDLFLRLDEHLGAVIAQYGAWTYGLLFTIVFLETGFVVTPFLPGDSLLFAAGAFAAAGALDVGTVAVLLMIAAILGDTVNYWIGRRVGPKVFVMDTGRLFRKEHLAKTAEFYEKHGPLTIVLARFVPIIRTFAPFVAGIGKMRYATFIAYNVGGGIAWVSIFVLGGYFFGNLPWVKEHFEAVILAIIALSVAPMIVELIKHRRAARPAAAAAPAPRAEP